MTTLVIGGGLQGLSTAMALVERGDKVRLLEARSDVGLETSFANGGLLTPSMPEPWNGPGVFRKLAVSLADRRSPMKLRLHALPGLVPWGIRFLRHATHRRYLEASVHNFRLARYSLEQHLRLAERISVSYDAIRHGVLAVFRSEQAMQERLELCAHLADSGMRYSVLDADAAVDIEPALTGFRQQIAGAIHFHDDVSGDAYRFCRRLGEELERRGAILDFSTTVRHLDVRQRRAVGVVTNEGAIRGDRIIVAAGVRSAILLGAARIRVAVQPVKGYSATLTLPDDLSGPRLPILDDAAHVVVTPLGNRLRAVGTAEFSGYDARIDPERIDNLVRVMQSLVPALATRPERPRVSPWAGLRPMSADGMPYIGATNVDGLFVNTGHGQLGWTLATGSAQLLADLMFGNPPAVDPEPFRVER